jgi:hypothetical protein
MHVAGALRIADRRVRVGLRGERRQQQIELRFP